jgi:hypothetical protein
MGATIGSGVALALACAVGLGEGCAVGCVVGVGAGVAVANAAAWTGAGEGDATNVTGGGEATAATGCVGRFNNGAMAKTPSVVMRATAATTANVIGTRLRQRSRARRR